MDILLHSLAVFASRRPWLRVIAGCDRNIWLALGARLACALHVGIFQRHAKLIRAWTAHVARRWYATGRNMSLCRNGKQFQWIESDGLSLCRSTRSARHSEVVIECCILRMRPHRAVPDR